ncbi:MAG: hypothetical protein O7E52_04080 [Candidatus Poribacteria bacterium]|nr:hypothetical protein [Candidatus Poribacteria bacterium]
MALPNTIERITPHQLKAKLDAGSSILSVAVEGRARYAKRRLPGAIHQDDFWGRLDSIPVETEIVTY